MKIMIVTVAGMSTRFSQSLGYECLKCLYFRNDIRESLLYRLLHQPVKFDRYIIVGGYKFESLKEAVDREFPDMADQIILVENPYYADYGSGYSLYCGLKEAMRYGFSQAVFAEGDLFVDAETFVRLCESPKDAVAVSPEPILAEKSVVFYLDRDERLHYLYDTGHDLLFIREPFRAVYNSGQIWKFTDPERLRGIYARMAETDWHGTNLVFMERYFGQLDRGDYDQFRFSEWVNCNTIEDFRRIPGSDGENRGGGR